MTIDTSNFNRAIHEMTRLTGAKFEDIVLAEVGSVLSQTIINTPKATKESIMKSSQDYIWIRNEGGTWNRKGQTYHGGTFYPMKWHYKDDFWTHVVNSKDARIKELIKRIGVAKQSWFKLANNLGIKLPKQPPGYVMKAAVNGRAFATPVNQQKMTSGSKVQISIENLTRSAIQGGGRVALLKAINGRTGYFYRNLKSGAFQKVSEIAKKYPGFNVRGV